MKRSVLILPGFFQAEGESGLKGQLPALTQLARGGEVVKIASNPAWLTPEAAYLGLSRHEGQMPPGPLRVAALGAEPPERSTHFVLSFGSVVDGQLELPEPPDAEEAAELFPLLARLNTKALTTLVGEGIDHALVWEGRGDLGTHALSKAAGQTMRDRLPEGDYETALRRLIDDSVNLLGEHDVNLRRQDEGRLPLNVLWPWGHGQRVQVPSLFLRRGEPGLVMGEDWRLGGLTRLAAYRFERIGIGVKTRLDLVSRADADVRIVVLNAPLEPEERHWFLRELDQRVLEPWAQIPQHRLLIIALAERGGLALRTFLPSSRENRVPFDERVLEESLPSHDLEALVDATVTLDHSES